MRMQRSGKGRIVTGDKPRTVSRSEPSLRNTAMADALLQALAAAERRKLLPPSPGASKGGPAAALAEGSPLQGAALQRGLNGAASAGEPVAIAATKPTGKRVQARGDSSVHPAPRPQANAAAAKPCAPDDRRRRLQARLSGLPDAYEARIGREAAWCAATEVERREVVDRIARGRDDLGQELDGASDDVVLGIDFGSTSTKVVARLPFFAGSPVAAMPVPTFARAEGNPHLWLSRIWVEPQGRIGILPSLDGAPLCALKTRLICAPTRESEAQAAAFLAAIVAYARGWAREQFTPIVRSANLRWSYNFGFPAEALDRGDLAERYRRVVAAALVLSRSNAAPTTEEAAAALTQVGVQAGETLGAFAATLQPEVAAVVAAAQEATRLPPGLFLMMDVGGVTVDCCTFKLIPGDIHGDGRMPIYQAAVETLGVECEALCKDDRLAHEDLRESVLMQLRTVIWDTYRDYMRGNPCWRDGLPILLVGGGARHPFYREMLTPIGRWLRDGLKSMGCPGLRLFDQPSFGGLLHEGEPEEVHRLCVALGLSNFEMPVVVHKREIDPLPVAKPLDLSDRHVGPEMT